MMCFSCGNVLSFSSAGSIGTLTSGPTALRTASGNFLHDVQLPGTRSYLLVWCLCENLTLSVALLDIGEGSFLPWWATKYFHIEDLDISSDTLKWIHSSNNLFYAWHWYGGPLKVEDAIHAMLTIQQEWNVQSFATEFMSCDIWNNASSANITHSYWHSLLLHDRAGVW